MVDYPGRFKVEDIFLKKLSCTTVVFCTASGNSDIELRITEKMDFILVEVSVGMKQKEKTGKSSETVKNSLRGELGSAVIMYSQCHGTRTVKKNLLVCYTFISKARLLPRKFHGLGASQIRCLSSCGKVGHHHVFHKHYYPIG